MNLSQFLWGVQRDEEVIWSARSLNPDFVGMKLGIAPFVVGRILPVIVFSWCISAYATILTTVS